MIRFVPEIVDRSPGRSRGAVPGLIPAGLSILYGESGARKTFTSVGLAVRVAAGLPFGRFQTQPGLVVIIAAEDEGGIDDRLAVSLHELGLPDTTPVGVMPLPIRADDRKFAELVIAEVRAAEVAKGIGCSLVILDTLAASVDGVSINDDGPVGAIAGNLLRIGRELGCSTLAVHHPGKGDKRRERGSQVIRDRADVSIRLEAKGANSIATVEKMRSGRTGDRLELGFILGSREIAGETIETLVLSRIDDMAANGRMSPEAAAPPPKGHAAKLYEVIQVMGPGVLNAEKVRDAFYVRLPGESENKRKPFQRAVKSLTHAGLVEAGHGTLRDIGGTRPEMSHGQTRDERRDMGPGHTPSFMEGCPTCPPPPNAGTEEGAAPERPRGSLPLRADAAETLEGA